MQRHLFLRAIIKVCRKISKVSKNIIIKKDVAAFDRRGCIYNANGQSFEIPKDELTDPRFRYRFVAGTYESSKEYEFVEKYLDRKGRILELGGCLGVMSCFANRLLDNTASHVVFEANPNLIGYLTLNRDRNKAGFSIKNKIIGTGVPCKFYQHDLIVGGSTVRETGKEILIDTEKPDQYVGYENLIIDIEGGELDLIRNYPEIFRNAVVLFIELHPFANILSTAENAECENLLYSYGLTKRDTDGTLHYQVWSR